MEIGLSGDSDCVDHVWSEKLITFAVAERVRHSSEARGVEPLFPACYVQQRPRMIHQSHFRGEYVSMNKRGRRRMLLVLLLGDNRLETRGDRGIGPPVSETRTVGSVGSHQRDKQ